MKRPIDRNRYVVRVKATHWKTDEDGHRSGHYAGTVSIPAMSLVDARALAELFRVQHQSPDAEREAEVCVVCWTHPGRLLVPLDNLKSFADHLSEAAYMVEIADAEVKAKREVHHADDDE